jgi:hypothetical protein
MAGILKFLGRAVDDLVKMGYPREVAERISSGELPMDYESRMARAMEQGYDPRTYYHGGSPDILNLDPTEHGSDRTYGTGTWFSNLPEIGNSYIHKGGSLYPVRIKTKGMDNVDAEGSTWGNIEAPTIKRNGNTLGYNEGEYNYVFSDDPSYSHPLFEDGDVTTTDEIARLSGSLGGKGVVFDNVVDIGGGYKAPREIRDNWLDWLLDYEQKGGRSVAVQDPSTVRSVNAAFDPEYTGSNILGSRMAPTAAAGLLGILGLTEDDLEDLK